MKRWLILGLVFLFAGIRYLVWDKTQPVYTVGQTVEIEMRLMNWPEVKYGKQVIRERNWEIRIGNQEELEAGEKVKIVSKISKKLINGKHIQYIADSSAVEILQESSWRKRCLNLIRRWLPGDMGVLAAGILLGGSQGLSKSSQESFKNMGMTHVVAASGYNVGVVAGWIMALGWRWLGRRKAIPFVLVSIGLYILMAGGSAAVVRAGVMAGATLVALSMGRALDAGYWLGLAAGGMIILKPSWLGDIGFQLSVAAMGGLIWVEPKLVGRWQDLKTTIAAQITTLPLIWHYFGQISVVAPLANGLLLWTVPPIMQITALALGAGIIWEPGGRLISWAAWPLLWLLTEGARWAGNLKFAAMVVKPISWWWVGGYYLTLIILLNLKNIKFTKE